MKAPKTAILISFFYIFTLLISCKSSCVASFEDEESPKPIVFSELNTGTNGGFTEKINKVITDQAGYNEAWFTAFQNFSEQQRPAKIDFENKMVILVAMGMQRTGGYSIKINSIEETKNNIIVNGEISKPGKTCMTTSVLTYPYQIIELKKSKKIVLFKFMEKVYDCEK